MGGTLASKKRIIHSFLIVLFLFISVAAAGSKHFPKKKFDETKIEKYSTKTLVDYLSYDSINWQYEKYGLEGVEYRIGDELVRRRPVKLLIKVFEQPLDEYQQLIVAQAMSEIEDIKIASVFKAHLTLEMTKTMYYCLKYLAKRGDKEALIILNNNHCAYPLPSYELAEVVRCFGQYKYEPSIPLLIDALDAASLNLVDAAQTSLEQFFEGPYPDWKTIEEMKEYFEKRYEDSLNKK
jgi:hypothetical protein